MPKIQWAGDTEETPARPRRRPPPRPREAKCDGTCPVCEAEWSAGDPIVWGDGAYICEGCALDVGYLQ